MAHSQPFPGMPPPTHKPSYCAGMREAIPNILYSFINRQLYIWLEDGESFWMFPTDIDDAYLYGYVWDGGWKASKVRWRTIESFY